MNDQEKSSVKSMAWLVCMMLSDGNLDKAKAKFDELIR
jgi:hypothetical protein